MPIIIGNKPDSDFSDPIGMLEDCHRRIEKFLNVLLTLADKAQANPLTDGQRAAVETSLRYFREGAPKHTADEEESLFPRMRASQHHEAKDILSDLDHLHTDHVTADQNHRAVDELFRRWLADGFLSAPEFMRLTSLLHSVRDTYARHIKEEETQIFPNAARILTPTDLKAVGLEMAKRRRL
ncbi:MAG TPA: hemerythrin domain-containing protein [Pyrinomonadaceae bacterium]|nr:hemerythrin domain-containing protein [Pyrinomonadaceae bacterium]